jgi:hypothetical protein
MESLELKRLTLVFPPGVEDSLIELLLEQDPPLPGFTIIAAEGHGTGFDTASTHELVRGRIKRRLMLMVLPADRIENLIAALREAIQNPHVAWWVEPVTDFGRLA